MPLFCADRHKKPAIILYVPRRRYKRNAKTRPFAAAGEAACGHKSPFSAQESLRFMVFIHNFAEIRRFAAQQRDDEAIKKQ